MGDRVRLAQVVSNLLHNAAKFTDPGGRVAVAVPADARDGRAAVSVRDTGIGIEPQLLPHVFETFIQADRTLDRSRGGLGLGLALVKGLVELQGGAVQASSPGLGQGSEFRFWLPLDEEAPAPGGGSSPGAAAPARCLRVLVVEDHRDTARTLRVLLTRYGHEVELAHTGTAGVEVARRWRPDVVLSDLGLPELDGYQVARTLRRDPVTASVCLIAVSGYGQDEDRRRCREAGFDLHLTKPVDPVELQRLLAGVVVEPRRPDPAAAGGPAPGLPEEKAGGEPASLDLLAHQGASSSLPAELHLRREAESG
jgi:CheY-like chemotaxis protein